MRMIERRMLSAIRNGQNWRGKNTAVLWGWRNTENIASVRLYGHQIAEVKLDGTVVHASLCGWDTATTRSRLSALGVDTWKLRYEEGRVTQEEYMAHLRRVENERTRRKLMSA